MNVIARIGGILLRPDREWLTIERESGDPVYLFSRYVAVLAAIPALTGYIGNSLIGVTTSAGSFRAPMLTGLLDALISYLFSFVIVYVAALIIDGLARSFRAQHSFPEALKLATYSFTPVWLAGIFLLVPGLRFLTVLGLYGLYLLWTGLPVLMRAPREKTLVYALASVAATILVIAVLAKLQAVIIALPRHF